jgi:hypothetical protein
MSDYKFKTTNIRGKAYVDVSERVKFFRQEEQYKNWTISTEVTMLDDKDECICKTIIADPEQRVIATGLAHEVKSSSNINKTSYVENCETSAVGRALAMLGIGIDASIASANEVKDAIAKQNASEDTTEADYQKAVTYLKNSEDVVEAWKKISKQSKTMFSKEKFDRLQAFAVEKAKS